MIDALRQRLKPRACDVEENRCVCFISWRTLSCVINNHIIHRYCSPEAATDWSVNSHGYNLKLPFPGMCVLFCWVF